LNELNCTVPRVNPKSSVYINLNLKHFLIETIKLQNAGETEDYRYNDHYRSIVDITKYD